MTLNGRPLTPQDGPFDEKIFIRREQVLNTALQAGPGVTELYCLGLQLLIVTPVGAFPPAGRYRAIGSTGSNDTGVAVLRVNFRDEFDRSWPFALSGIHLEAKGGYLQLDEMTASTARGTFRTVMRRQANGS